MKKYVALLVLLLLTVSCGGGGSSSGGGSNGSTPRLLAFDFSPTSGPANQNITILLTLSFTDAGGDLDGGSLYIQTSLTGVTTGTTIQAFPVPASYNGITQSSITTPFSTNTGRAGVYTYQIWLVDNKGNRSNTLTRTFTST